MISIMGMGQAVRASEYRWTGIDGEGVGRHPHRYVMLCRHDGESSDYIEDVNGLSTAACLGWLLRAPERARLCGYYLGYDWTKILKDLPNKAIYRLFRPELRKLPADEGDFSRIKWRGYRLHYLAGAMQIRKGRRAVTVWDLGKYYQCPFVKAIQDSKIPGAVEMIEQMKGERGTWGDDDLNRMLRYCLEECRMLAELANQLEQAHAAVGLRPSHWYGPGSTAAIVLKKHRIHARRGVQSSDLSYAADSAYFGGRFEHSMIGRRSRVHGYDIVSAYPAQAAKLPCLLHARWEHVTTMRELRNVEQACVHFKVKDVGADQAWAPLPCRLEDGSIVYARGGFRGWCWLDEFRAAREYWNSVRLIEAFALRRNCDCQPFSFVTQLYEARRVGTVEERRIYKYVLNSLYGKLAQRRGSPRFASVIWAGMITSGTRAELLRMLARHKSHANVIALATDGLYSSEVIKGPIDGNKNLGEWDHEYHGPMWFVRPGIYWSEKDETLRARGLGRKQLAGELASVRQAIEWQQDEARCGVSQAFGSARQCVYMNPHTKVLKRSPLFGQWFDVPSRIGLTPLPKRNYDWSLRMFDNIESRPYSVTPKGVEAIALEIMGMMFDGRR